MEKLWGFFKKCEGCRAKFPPPDGYSLCVLCLGEAHRVDSCLYCTHFLKTGKKETSGLIASSPHSAKQILNLFSKTATSAVCLCRHAWLCPANLQPNTRAVIEDLFFEGEVLFSNTTDTILLDMDKCIKASCNLGTSSPKHSRQRSWSQSWSRYPY